jgi:hypothetical protein
MSILALTSDTLIGTPATGNIEYNGQFFGTDSNASRAQLQRIVQETAQLTTSGTSKDFTGIPAWVKKITVMFNGVSTNGTNNYQIQIGSGSVVTTGYSSASIITGNSVVVASSGITTGFMIRCASGSNFYTGAMSLFLIASNTWVSNHVLHLEQAGVVFSVQGGGYAAALSGALDRVRITTVGGTDTFDAGSVNIMYEG